MIEIPANLILKFKLWFLSSMFYPFFNITTIFTVYNWYSNIKNDFPYKENNCNEAYSIYVLVMIIFVYSIVYFAIGVIGSFIGLILRNWNATIKLGIVNIVFELLT